jgi:hypothetical protein
MRDASLLDTILEALFENLEFLRSRELFLGLDADEPIAPEKFHIARKLWCADGYRQGTIKIFMFPRGLDARA